MLRVHGSGEGGRGIPRSIRAAAASTDLAGRSTRLDERSSSIFPPSPSPSPCCQCLTPSPARPRSRPCRRLPSPHPYVCPPPSPLSPPPAAHSIDGVTMLPDSCLRSSVCGSCSCTSARGFATVQATAAGAGGSSVSARATRGRGAACWAAALGFEFS
jgi:hypothetical protein